MTTRRTKAVIEYLLRKGGTMQGTVCDKPDHIRGAPKKVKPVSDKKRQPTEKQLQRNEDERIIRALPVGRTSVKLEKEE